ncbi:hypothetical protein ACFQIA_06425 [Halalkalicoccus sp. GCM10025704]
MDQRERARDYLREEWDGERSLSEIADELDVSQQTVHRAKRELEEKGKFTTPIKNPERETGDSGWAVWKGVVNRRTVTALAVVGVVVLAVGLLVSFGSPLISGVSIDDPLDGIGGTGGNDTESNGAEADGGTDGGDGTEGGAGADGGVGPGRAMKATVVPTAHRTIRGRRTMRVQGRGPTRTPPRPAIPTEAVTKARTVPGRAATMAAVATTPAVTAVMAVAAATTATKRMQMTTAVTMGPSPIRTLTEDRASPAAPTSKRRPKPTPNWTLRATVIRVTRVRTPRNNRSTAGTPPPSLQRTRRHCETDATSIRRSPTRGGCRFA